MSAMSERHVVIVVYDGLQPLDAVGPHEVFAGANQWLDSQQDARPRYRLRLAATTAVVRGESGLPMVAEPLPAHDVAIDTLLVAGGDGSQAARYDSELTTWLVAAAPRARRFGTVCSGTFVAAEAGLLDGCTVTTHWARASQLAEEYPALTVDSDPIYLRHGSIWSSAGVTAGIDMALAMVEDDLGAEVAQTIARWLVMFVHRPGGQTQFATPVWTPRANNISIRATQDYIDANPGEDLRVDRLAARTVMSERHFSRQFTAEVGTSPARYVERARIEAARRALEVTTDTVETVASRCGFGAAETLRRSFHRHLGVSPDAYRQRFRAPT